MNENIQQFTSSAVTCAICYDVLLNAMKSLGAVNASDENKIKLIAYEELTNAIKARAQRTAETVAAREL